MPELPEVEALCRFLDARLSDAVVREVDLVSVTALKTVSPRLDALHGRRVTAVRRHGKWIDVVAQAPDDDALHLLTHLGRAGWVRWHDSLPPRRSRPSRSPVALRVRLEDGSGFELTEAGTRRRLAVHVVHRPEEVQAVADLGVDPLADLTTQRLTELARRRNQQVKGLLRDQRAIAGIGNAYSDEILHAARMSPFALTGSLTGEELETLIRVTREVLRDAVDAAVGRPAAELKDTKRRGMAVHGRTGLPCPVCQDVVREVAFADSSLQYCATCQTGGRALADRHMSRLLR